MHNRPCIREPGGLWFIPSHGCEAAETVPRISPMTVDKSALECTTGKPGEGRLMLIYLSNSLRAPSKMTQTQLRA